MVIGYAHLLTSVHQYYSAWLSDMQPFSVLEKAIVYIAMVERMWSTRQCKEANSMYSYFSVLLEILYSCILRSTVLL